MPGRRSPCASKLQTDLAAPPESPALRQIEDFPRFPGPVTMEFRSAGPPPFPAGVGFGATAHRRSGISALGTWSADVTVRPIGLAYAGGANTAINAIYARNESD